MSWDVFVQDLPSTARTVADIPDNFSPAPLGRRTDLIARIREVVPFADFSDPARGHIDTPDLAIEISMGTEEIVSSFVLFVRGGDQAASCVVAILHHLGLRALDSGTGDILDPSSAVAGLRQWRAYRNQIVPSSQ